MKSMSYSLKIEGFLKNKLKDHSAMLAASKLIDDFRASYGKVTKGFNSTKFIRKMRNCRK